MTSIRKYIKKAYKRIRRYWHLLVGKPQNESVIQVSFLGPKGGGKTSIYRALYDAVRGGAKCGPGELVLTAIRELNDKPADPRHADTGEEGDHNNELDEDDVDYGALQIEMFRSADEAVQREIPEASKDLIAVAGYAESRGSRLPFVLYDSPGEILDEQPPLDLGQESDKKNVDISEWPSVYKLAFRSDLLVVVLPPEFTTDPLGYSVTRGYGRNERLTNHMVHCIEIFMRYNPDGMLAFVYSKSDEYGAVITKARRLAHSLKQVKLLKKFRKQQQSVDENPESNPLWQAIINEIVSSAKNERETAWASAQRGILNKTYPLWRLLRRVDEKRAVNGYFVSTKPVEGQPREWSTADKGFLQLFSDYFYHRKHIKNRPALDRYFSPYLLMVTFVVLLVSTVYVYFF